MTKKLSRERALTATLDHLHTEATELARFASKASDDSAAAIEALPTSTTPAATRRRPLISRWRRTLAAFGAILFASFGSVTLAGSAAFADTTATPNSVLSFGAAPRIAPDFGLALRAGVIGITANPAGKGYSVFSTNANFELAQNSVPSPRDRNALVLPIPMQENLGFKFAMQPVAALTIAQAASDAGAPLNLADIKITLVGLIKRNVF